MSADEPGATAGAVTGARGAAERRHASWLELFFDLVFVGFVGQLALRLHGDPTAGDFAVFVLLFFPAWWLWIDVLLTTNLFGRRATGVTWLVMITVMFAVGIMAAAVSAEFPERAWAFAAANALARLVMLPVWLFAAKKKSLDWWRPALYSGLTAALWLASIAFRAPGIYIVWVVSMLIELVLSYAIGRQGAWLRRALDIDHMSERIGLFVVIVFGETIFTLIVAASEHWTLASGATTALGFIIVALLAWSFFTYGATLAERAWGEMRVRGDIAALRDTATFLPFFLVIGIVSMAAGLGTAVSEPLVALPNGAAIALCGGVALFYATNGAVSLRYGQPLRRVLAWAAPGVLGPLVLAALSGLVTSLALVAMLAVFLAVLVLTVRFRQPST
ncbi:low temperature requirement protein A [Diaminobutyricibacter sp. McL0608]|uniref:low temperature requirement protein A n=1 Tax=Leifsonia sp. McL0608 TaxID=3143537 RepID=UPI0031F2E465